MTPLQSAILDLVTSCRGDDEPLDVLLAELRIRPEWKDVPMLWPVKSRTTPYPKRLAKDSMTRPITFT